jgi:hypothetical protein
MSLNEHMDALRETLVDKFNITLNDSKEIHNKMLEGKYPERQAYNKDGLLVTFPTPQHKTKAISRGTHFEQDPTKAAPNVFAAGQQPAAQPAAAQPSAQPAEPQQNIFPTGGEPQQPAAQPEPAPTPAPAPAPAAQPATAAQPSALPKSDTPDAIQSGGETLAVEPAQTKPTEPSTPPETTPPPKSEEQKEAESQVVKQIMRGDNADLTTQPSINEQWEKVEQYCRKENLKEVLESIRLLKTK